MKINQLTLPCINQSQLIVFPASFKEILWSSSCEKLSWFIRHPFISFTKHISQLSMRSHDINGILMKPEADLFDLPWKIRFGESTFFYGKHSYLIELKFVLNSLSETRLVLLQYILANFILLKMKWDMQALRRGCRIHERNTCNVREWDFTINRAGTAKTAKTKERIGQRPLTVELSTFLRHQSVLLGYESSYESKFTKLYD